MVMLAEPLEQALQAAQAARQAAGLGAAPVLLFSPAGTPLTQQHVAAALINRGFVSARMFNGCQGVQRRLVAVYIAGNGGKK